jgi:imidazolonepropionase-like amidohydrolase
LRRRTLLRAITGALVLPALAVAAEPAPPTALVGGRLVDGYGGMPLEDSVVLIDGERIVAVGSMANTPVPAAAIVVSAEGCTVLPGLIDACTHLARLGHADLARWDSLYLPLAERVVMPLAAQQVSRAGVAAVHDLGSPLEATLRLRGRGHSRATPQPRIHGSGPLLARRSHPGFATIVVDDAREARVRALELLRAGVDSLVVADAAALAGDGELGAIVAAAHAQQVAVHALIGSDDDLLPALEAGVDGWLGVGDGSAAPWPPGVAEALARRPAATPLVVASLLSPALGLGWLKSTHEPLDDRRWREGWPALVADDVRESLSDAVIAELAARDSAARQEVRAKRVAALVGAGALVVAGSGAGLPAQLPAAALAAEIEALALAAGLGSAEAIRRATYWPAVALGVQHESGTVTVGKYADLLCVRGDVLRHVDRISDVEAVFRRGVRLA